MSGRTLDKGLITLIRELMARVSRLEGQDSAVRRNDIRLGKVVVDTDSQFLRVGIKNIKTGEKKMIGNPADVTFSYSGSLAVDGNNSPPFVTPQVSTASEVILAMNSTSSDDTTIRVFFDDDYSLDFVLGAGETISTNGVNVPISKNMRIYTTVVSIGSGTPADLSVVIRFGTTAANIA